MSRTIFIGNIPFDLSETQLTEIFQAVGTVQSFRLVFDRETGKPKGFGFCSYGDHETAASAVRNLNNYDVNGRNLRVDFAEQDKEDFGNNAGGSGGGNGGNAGPARSSRAREESAVLEDFAQPTSTTDTITGIVKGMDPQQLAEVLAYLKVMIQNAPDQATALLNQNPQLSFGLFQALMSMNLVDAYSMQRILQTNSSAQYQQPAPQVNAAPSAAQQAVLLQEQQKQLMIQLINLTPEQIQALPPDQQAQVLQLRAQIMQQQ